MLTGQDLGRAIKTAIERKAVTQKAVAAHFGVQPPSVQDWIKRGTIGKDKLPGLWSYFADVVGPAHWGLEQFPGSGDRSEHSHAKKLALSTDLTNSNSDSPSTTGCPSSNTKDGDKPTTNVAAAPALRPSSRVPVVGQVKAGRDGYLEESAYDGEVEYWTADRDAFALRVQGDSMHPRYRAGEFVIVSPNVEPVSSTDVVVTLKCGRKLLKQLNWKREDELQLLSINGDYAPETLLLTDVLTIQKVLGSVGADALLKSR